jgi:ABC-type lipoprotein release transport system permease subunit
MYSEVNARTFWIPGICVLLSALFVALFPATRAAHTPPAKSMRMH